MKNLNQYFQGQLEEQQSEELTAHFIQQKFDEASKAEWSEYLREHHGVTRKSTLSIQKKRKRWYAYVAGIAASLLLLLTLLFWPKTDDLPKYQKLVAEYTQSLPIMADQLAFRKGSQAINDTRLLANEAFADRQYERAIQEWEKLLPIAQANHFDLFYLGTSYLLQKQPNPTQAISYLRQSKAKSNELKHEINWVLALAHLKQQEFETARVILDQIVVEKTYMVEEALALLDALPPTQ